MRKHRIASFVASTALAAGVALAAGPSALAAPVAPDEWHCTTVTAHGDQLCLHLNQVLGWWTGFTAEYRRSGSTGGHVNVRLYWSGTAGGYGFLPSADRVYTLYTGEVGGGGDWADLPSFACVSVWAWIVPPGASWFSHTLTVCRNT